MAEKADDIQSFEEDLDLNTEIKDSDNILDSPEDDPFADAETDAQDQPKDEDQDSKDSADGTEATDDPISNNSDQTDEQEQVDQNDLTNFFEDLGHIEKDEPKLQETLNIPIPEKKKKESDGKFLKSVGAAVGALNIVKHRKLLAKPFSGGGKKVWISVAFLAIIAVGGWWLYQNTSSFAGLFNLFGGDDFMQDVDVDDYIDDTSDVLVSELETEKITLTPPSDNFGAFRIDPNGNWIVQIAACLSRACRQSAVDALQNHSIPNRLITQESKIYNAQFIKLFAVELFRYQTEAEEVMKKINSNNSFGINSFIEQSANGLRLVIGYYPLKTYGINDILDKVRSEISALYPDILLNTIYEKGQNTLSRVVVGPFAQREKAQQFLDILQTNPGFQQAVVIRK